MGPDAGAARRADGHRARPADAAANVKPSLPPRPLRRARAQGAPLCRGVPGDRPRRDQARPGARDSPRPGRRRGRARTSLRLQDRLPPAALFLRRSRRRSSRARQARSKRCSASIDPKCRWAPRRSRRSTAPSRPKARPSRSRCCVPPIEEDFASALETYEWAAAQVEAFGGEKPRGSAPADRRRAPSGNGPMRELDLRREAASASELKQRSRRRAGFHIPDDRLEPHGAHA